MQLDFDLLLSSIRFSVTVAGCSFLRNPGPAEHAARHPPPNTREMMCDNSRVYMSIRQVGNKGVLLSSLLSVRALKNSAETTQRPSHDPCRVHTSPGLRA